MSYTMADQGTTQATMSFGKLSAATAEASTVLQNAYSTAAQGAMACNAKVIEFARANSDAAFDYASQLFGVKSPPEFLAVSSAHARKQFAVLSEQAKEFSALSQKVMAQTAEPLTTGAAKAFRVPLA